MLRKIEENRNNDESWYRYKYLRYNVHYYCNKANNMKGYKRKEETKRRVIKKKPSSEGKIERNQDIKNSKANKKRKPGEQGEKQIIKRGKKGKSRIK